MATPRRQVVLASASPSRLRLMQSCGMEPTVISSQVDEDFVTAQFWAARPGATIGELAAILAEAKATDVAGTLDKAIPGALVVGGDSVLEWAGQALGKPGSVEAAIARLTEMNGTSGVLHTGHCVIDCATAETRTSTASTRVDFAPMTADEIAAYVRTGEPLAVAGSFTLDGLSAPFIEGVVGDPSNVIGLSLPLLRTMFGELGIEWLEVVSY